MKRTISLDVDSSFRQRLGKHWAGHYVWDGYTADIQQFSSDFDGGGMGGTSFSRRRFIVVDGVRPALGWISPRTQADGYMGFVSSN
jgi:hypothetical protein